jgi:hypothetical protein
MNALSDSLTIGLVLALVFGALFFYMYTRIGQVEKRVGLTENILLDLKMATENTIMAMASSGSPDMEVTRVEAMSEPAPLGQEEVEQIPDEEFYKSVLQQVPSNTPEESPVEDSVRPVDVNYEAMTLKELKALAKQKNIAVSATAHKKDVIEALKRQGQGQGLEPVPGSLGAFRTAVEEDGFPVELGSAENRKALQE